MDLASFHREIDRPAALVAEDDVELGADRVFKQPWKVETRAGCSAGILRSMYTAESKFGYDRCFARREFFSALQI